MSSSRVMVGMPLEKSRSRGRGGWRKWPVAESQVRRAPVLKAELARSSAEVLSELEDILPAPGSEGRSLTLLPTRHFLVMSAIAGIVIFLVWGLVRSNHLSVGLSYEISALTRERMALQEINRQLETELAGFGSLAELEEAARGILGLITPNQGQIVVIDP